MSNLYMQQVELISNGLSFTEPNFRIYYKVGFDYDEDPNVSEISILNLSNDSISRFQKDVGIILNAGYSNDVGTITTGIIQKVELEDADVDRTLKITAFDTTAQYLDAKINKSYTAGTKASYIVRDILGGLGLEIGDFQLSNDISYARGKVVSGSLRSALKNIVIEDCQSKLYTNNGIITILPYNQGKTIAFVLNSNTGLLESPKKIEKNNQDKKPQGDYTVKMLLNHRVTVDSIFVIQSKTANGTFRVLRGSHKRNESTSITECEVIAV